MAKKNVDTLIADVGALIDITPTDSTAPSRAQIVSWLNEGALNVMRLAPIHELLSCYVTNIAGGSYFQKSDFSSNPLRIVQVLRNGLACREVDLITFDSFNSIDAMSVTSRLPVYKVDNDETIRVLPLGTIYVHVSYVPHPFVYELATPTPDPDNTAVPVVYEEMVVEYAALKYRIQDEEPAQYKMFIEEWRQKLQMNYSVKANPIEGV